MLSNLTGMHALVILAIVVFLFGAAKLPALARSVGQSVRILKKEVEDQDGTTADAPAVTADPVVAALATTPIVSTASTTSSTSGAAGQVAARQAQRIS